MTETNETGPVFEVRGPVAVTCPACDARPGRPCTAPTNFGRRPVAWVHLAREDAAGDSTWEAE